MHTLNTDGGSRGNPGPSGCAFVIANAGKVVTTGKYFLGTVTNNQAEYMGAILGLTEALKKGITEITLVMDSELVIKQLQGIYKVKDAGMKVLNQKAKMLIAQFTKVDFQSVLREKNKLADELANKAMDDESPIYDMRDVTAQNTLW